ncbi:MAG: PorP/SprF family type IX secretion system membrane protein [Paludibacteraceae bacterium]|nr:PorP/SprF family type IX secretion system membrane protein [Paludibacteraceae bacterium]
MKKVLALICLMMTGVAAQAQQDLLLSQQFYSRINKNPAGTGNVPDYDFFLLGHYQYIDVKDAPKSLVFNAQTFMEQYNSGVGFSLSYDNMGVAKSTTNAKLVYAYSMKLNETALLSFGLSAGVQYGYFNAAEYTYEDYSEVEDGEAPAEKETKLNPDFDFGLEFSTPRFLLGMSITHLTNNESSTLTAGRHFYAYGRYMFTLNETWDIAPALVYMHKDLIDVTELSATAFYNRFIWGGLTYHPDINQSFETNPLAITLGVEYRSFRIGYTFDYAFGKVSRLSGSSHELMFSYSMENKKKSAVYEKFE